MFLKPVPLFELILKKRQEIFNDINFLYIIIIIHNMADYKYSKVVYLSKNIVV